MLGVLDGSDRWRLASPQHFEGEGYRGLHAFVPAMLGVLVPLLVPLVFAPALVGKALPLLLALLLAMLAFAACVAVYSMLFKGDVVSITILPDSGRLCLVHSGLFANATTHIPLAEVATVDMSPTQPGRRYQPAFPRLVLSDGRMMRLPEEITRGEVIAFRGRIEEARRKHAK
ncbi:MAG: hypothetical protein JNM89_02930 [Hyphomicrobiaceae bacterium]|nr:hypothetical protein [Hyphomicrobiaceae bacterium]